MGLAARASHETAMRRILLGAVLIDRRRPPRSITGRRGMLTCMCLGTTSRVRYRPTDDRSKPPGALRSATRFCSVTGEYGELSNFAHYPITLKGKRRPTSEHYFQAQKFVDRAIKKRSAARTR